MVFYSWQMRIYGIAHRYSKLYCIFLEILNIGAAQIQDDKTEFVSEEDRQTDTCSPVRTPNHNLSKQDGPFRNIHPFVVLIVIQ